MAPNHGYILTDVSGEPVSRTYQYRKVMKPMLERKRRARINRCLDELKELMTGALQTEGENVAKLEKADILELTVRHLHSLRRQNGLRSEQSYADKFKAGFRHCANEVTSFLGKVDKPTSVHVVNHLNSFINQLEILTVTQQSQVMPNSSSSPTNSYSSSPPIGQPGHQQQIPQPSQPSQANSPNSAYYENSNHGNVSPRGLISPQLSQEQQPPQSLSSAHQRSHQRLPAVEQQQQQQQTWSQSTTKSINRSESNGMIVQHNYQQAVYYQSSPPPPPPPSALQQPESPVHHHQHLHQSPAASGLMQLSPNIVQQQIIRVRQDLPRNCFMTNDDDDDHHYNTPPESPDIDVDDQPVWRPW